MNILFRVLVIVLIVLLLVSCNTDIGNIKKQEENENIDGEIVIGVSPLTLQLEYYISYVQSIKKAAEKYNVKVVILDAMWDNSKQISNIRDFENMGVDGIICSPVHPEEIKDVLIDVEEKGIPVVIEMTQVEGIYPLVVTDQFKGGKLAGTYAGEWINKTYNGFCDVAILDFPYFKNITDRVKGFEEGLKEKAPSAEIVARVDAKAKMETAIGITENIIAEYPDVKCIFGINDDSAKGANAAFEDSGIPPNKICIIGFDADKGAKKLINAKRYLKASVAADTDKIAEKCIETMIKKINNEEIPQWVEVKDAQYIITQENIEDYYN